MTANRQILVGPLLGALALSVVSLSACAATTATPEPAPPAPVETVVEPASVEIIAAPAPQIVIARADPVVAPEPPANASESQPADVAQSTATSADAGAKDAGNETTAARETLQTYLDATTSLRADFRSVLLDERRVPVAESSGVVMVKRPHRFRWEYREPSPSLILADGDKLWSYDAELEQAVVRSLADMEGANPSNLLGGDSRVDEDFDVLGSYRADTVEWIDLRPRGESDFTRVRLGFAEGRIELMELHDQLGQVTQIALSAVETNAELSDELFRFEPPPGTDVVGAD